MRWRRGTTDHDGDGKMGGSMKESTMSDKKTETTRASDGATRPVDDPAGEPVPATQAKPSSEYADDEPMTKAPTKSGTAAFDGEEGLRARNSTMEPADTSRETGQTGTASNAKKA